MATSTAVIRTEAIVDAALSAEKLQEPKPAERVPTRWAGAFLVGPFLPGWFEGVDKRTTFILPGVPECSLF